jgi:molybdopterin molybdotransferase
MAPVSVQEALARLREVAPQPALRLPLKQTIGHVLAHEVRAPWPLPQWTAASMDGYAVRATDVRGASPDNPVTLPVSGGGDAGDPVPPPLAPGTAWRVATGGRVPEGADSVVRVEDVSVGPPLAAGDLDPTTTITIKSARDAGRNVRPAGGDVAEGSVALTAGTRVTPGVLALLAALGESAPMVHRTPRVAIITSGEEVASLEQRDLVARGERIADVNLPMLTALVHEAGGVPVPVGLVRDDVAAMADAVRNAADADFLLTAGAISVGLRDHVPAAMASLGARVEFRRVRVRPGGPTTLATLPDGRPWLALPGNPVSAFVTFHLFARPVIAVMKRESENATRRESARLVEPVMRDPVLEQFVRVTLDKDDSGALVATLTGNQGSWVTTSIARADALARIPAGVGEVTEAEVLLL